MFLRPEDIVEKFQIGEGMTVADFGVGTGLYTIAAAKAAGDEGVVYGIDVQKELLSKLAKEAKDEGIDNIRTVWSDLEEEKGSTLSDESISAAIATNVLFQIEHKERFLKEIFRVLKPGGKMLVVDWSDSFGGAGPHAGSVVRRNVAQSLAEQTGFSFEKDIDAGSHHYGLIFRKPRK